ncbi:MAG: divisome protein SepX/GlpR [Nocardioides sp.]
MDLSSWIFVALAVAWAVYLIPKALQHHDDVVRSRSVDRFSHTMRVLARREPVNRRNARLVVQPGRPATAPVVTAKVPTPVPAPVQVPAAAPSPAQLRARREAANAAARRRRRVLGSILVLNLVVVAVAAFSLVSWWYVAAPAGLLVAWLVACRLMVRHERGAVAPGGTATGPSRRLPLETEEEDEEAAPEKSVPEMVEQVAYVPGMDDTSEMAAARLDPTLWDPVPVTLPTYVTKPAATRRTVRTINLDDSGVWTSGRTDADAAIAREAHEADKAARARQGEGDDHRAVGS